MDHPPEQQQQQQQQPHPQRLSALYQYHNAPEVAPAHGLEYDDSNYPSSDKYPVVHSAPTYGGKWSGSKGFGHDTKPPRIIFGMKVKTFLVVAAIMIMVIVGAAVGGAVGGGSIKNNTPEFTASNSSTATTTAASATPSTYSAPTPNYTPLNDCPKSNNTIYSSTFSTGYGGSVQPNAKLNFTRYCDVASPLSSSTTVSGTFVYSFEDCIEACAAYNFYGNNAACTVAVFQASATRPANCWLGSRNSTDATLPARSGIDVALSNT